MSLEILQLLWYIVLGISIVMYIILDGFDLGVGSLHIFTKTDKEKRLFLNSIGPFWDGNEVWLIIILGGTFVGFPDVYAVVLSGFYTLFLLMMMSIIFRAISIEFRSKMPTKTWRSFWDTVFWLGSLGITFFAGVILANFVQGLPVGSDRELYYSFWRLFTPYAICMGVLSICLFAMHGNIFLLMKTEGALQKKLYKWMPKTTALFCLFFLITTFWTWVDFPYMIKRFLLYPEYWLVPTFLVASLLTMMFFIWAKRFGYAFLFSMLTIASLMFLFMVGTFPNIIISTIDKAYHLTLWNASASYTTLAVVLVVAAIGVPMVLGYGFFIYSVFRGKTELHDHSY